MEFLDWLTNNINSIASQKAPYQKWMADTAEFVDGSHAYIEYYDTAEDDENADVDEDTYRKALIEMNVKADGEYDVKALAYWKMGLDDFELASGSDKFADQNDSDYLFYVYDPDEEEWVRI
jgi:hypothetical protein